MPEFARYGVLEYRRSLVRPPSLWAKQEMQTCSRRGSETDRKEARNIQVKYFGAASGAVNTDISVN